MSCVRNTMASAIDNRATPCARNLSHRLCQYGGSAMEIPRMRGGTSVSQASPRTHSSDNALGIVGLWRTFRKKTISATLANLLDQSNKLMRTHTDLRFASTQTFGVLHFDSTKEFAHLIDTPSWNSRLVPTWNSGLVPTWNSRFTFVIPRTQPGIPGWKLPETQTNSKFLIGSILEFRVGTNLEFQVGPNLEFLVEFLQ